MMAATWAYENQTKYPEASEFTSGESVPSAGFFSSDLRRHEDLKNMLDSSKDGLKLEAMKRIIGMIAKGKDASELFPAVVKNVVSKNIEVKKLVYVYLVRYAEEQQDLALLSISTFQRALKDPNQLIRASALRVLSSIRVPVIVPIMMLSIKDAVNDMSPYVRKTAAHAIPKLHSLDPEQKDQLIEVIEKLLADKTTLVVGSAVMAFEEVCPERIDLIHKNYRKLCNLLVDVEEWGQVEIILMLTRYARTQFVDPNKLSGGEEERPFYDSGDEDRSPSIDPDLRLLLRNCKPLLQSRNSAVVVAVAQLYYHLAPRSEVVVIVKSLIRLLRSHREIQTVILSNVATMSTKHRGMFEPFLKSFFVRSSDPTHIKLLKLEVLTNLASETNVPIILREFQTYVASSDTEFVAATIQSIGRCASSIKEVADTCLNGLVSLLSNRNEGVVAESVVVIKKLLQMQPSEHKDIIGHMARLMDTIAVPMARASILWLLGEYADRVPKIAPDVLRKVAKTFIQEEDIVKLQTLNLASKLYLTNPKQTKLITQYVFSLAKYDQNYDIRDRVRFLRQLIMPQGETGTMLSKHAKKFLLAAKPAPILQSKFEDRNQYQMGSLSQFINARANEYRELPDFPEEAPDPSVRNVEVPTAWQESRVTKKKQVIKKKSFYSETDSSSSEGESSSESSGAAESSEEGSASESESTSDDSEQSGVEEDSDSGAMSADSRVNGAAKGDSEETSSGSDDESTTSSSGDEKKAVKKKEPLRTPTSRKNLDLLLDLDDIATVPSAPLQPLTAFTMTAAAAPKSGLAKFAAVSVPAYVPTEQKELLNKLSGSGLSVTYRFSRTPNIFSPRMTSIELTLTNHGDKELVELHIPDRKSGLTEVKGFPRSGTGLGPNQSVVATVGIDFNESTQQATLEVRLGDDLCYPVVLKPPAGEILQPVRISKAEFLVQQGKLKGMNESSCVLEVSEESVAKRRVHVAANLMALDEQEHGVVRFAGQTLATGSLVLVSVLLSGAERKGSLTVNCEKMVIGSMLLKELREALS